MGERRPRQYGTIDEFRSFVNAETVVPRSNVHMGRFEAGIEGQRPSHAYVDETKIMPAVTEPEVIPGDNYASYPEKAIGIVARYILAGYPPNPDFKDGLRPYVVWFSKTLQNWKALVGVPLLDGRYYEVTYNGDKRETYLDVYQKVENLVIRDEDL